uniref:Secreted protein n=1 Tax=Suricata suricatta TaxID=37032 RepID=A0A673TTC4_SURSU
MWLPRRWGSPRALMTLPSARRLLLIWMLSLSRSPVLPVLSTRSEPARSTKWNLETSSWPAGGRGRRLGARPRCSRVTVKTVCERLDRRLRCVAPVWRAALPISSRLSTSSRPSTATSFTPHSTEGMGSCEPRAAAAREGPARRAGGAGSPSPTPPSPCPMGGGGEGPC